MQRLKYWILAARPKTLTVSLAPVLLGSALAYQAEKFSVFYATLSLLGALLIQIGTNLCNDYYDFQKGADTHERVGPVRVTQSGFIPAHQVRIGFISIFVLAIIIGLFLVWRGGWPIIEIGIASILSGILYTAGPYPLAYAGLGELFVFIFFGPIAVTGTYYVQTLQWNWESCWSGFALGFLACAILAVNNLRDLKQDKKASKKTLAVRFGTHFAHYEYFSCLFLASSIAFYFQAWLASLLSLTALLFFRKRNLRQLLSQTALLTLFFSLAWAWHLIAFIE